MTAYPQIAIQPSLAGIREDLIREVQRGLVARPRSLSPWMFYDERGSTLFERITALPEYYPTRTERSILASFTDDIVATVLGNKTRPLRILELGAGTGSKTGILLDAAVRMQAEVLYMPVDVSSDALDTACQSIACALPEVRTEPIVANYVTQPPQLESFDGVTLILYLGSSIGNFSPHEARSILRKMSLQMRSGDAFVLGTDMVKDELTLIAAYDDRQGVTAAFNLNILQRINRELDADFDLACFRHRAIWNPVDSRIEMHLESTRKQRAYIAAAQLDLHLAQNETIHTENSYKFTPDAIRTLLRDSGFEVENTWKDSRDWYAVTLAIPQKLHERR
jgi:L-histidine Nalpha-methyltransferase